MLLCFTAAAPSGAGAADVSAYAAELWLHPAEMQAGDCMSGQRCLLLLLACQFPYEYAIFECRTLLHKPVSFFAWVQQTAAGWRGLLLYSDGMMW